MDNPTSDRIAKLEAENGELKQRLQYAAAPVDKGIPMSKYRFVCEERDAALAQLAMAREALEEWRGLAAHLGFSTMAHRERTKNLLAATAPAVAEYVGRLKEKGAAEAYRAEAEEWNVLAGNAASLESQSTRRSFERRASEAMERAAALEASR